MPGWKKQLRLCSSTLFLSVLTVARINPQAGQAGYGRVLRRDELCAWGQSLKLLQKENEVMGIIGRWCVTV